MATISVSNECITLIDIFEVDPAHADELLKALEEATDTVMRGREGFISANLHRSADGTRVVNYAQWRSLGDFEAMRDDPGAREHMKTCAVMAKRFEPILSTVAYAS